ncbi:hypothetical protein ACO34A_11540 [Rhizobium sp. ACO-34A]|nr:hypothetical protein [Rhizobium sp. ACO-34A]ATN34434.1 hypothetical protein ACO34A_11540 [Rhizobium sp. ACO-34A]
MPLDIVLSLSFEKHRGMLHPRSGSGIDLDVPSPIYDPRLAHASASGRAGEFGKEMFTGQWRKSFCGPSSAYAA